MEGFIIKRKKCWQRQMRDSKELEDIKINGDWWKELDLSSKNAEIRIIDYQTAKEVILEYEWLKSMPSGAFLCVGLYFDNYIAGVEVFTEIKAGGKYTLFNKPATCLARGCCVHWCPKWGSSYLISKALKILEEYYKGEPRYVIAFSDWEAGEIGTVYQASNRTYLGTRDYYQWLSPDGKRYDQRHHANIAIRKDPDFKKTKKLNSEITMQVKKELLENGWKIVKITRGKYATIIGYNSKKKLKFIDLLNQAAKPYHKIHKKTKDQKQPNIYKFINN